MASQADINPIPPTVRQAGGRIYRARLIVEKQGDLEALSMKLLFALMKRRFHENLVTDLSRDQKEVRQKDNQHKASWNLFRSQNI